MKIMISYFLTLVISAQLQLGIPYVEIEAAFDKKDTKVLTRLCNNKLSVSLFGKENIYSIAQAEMILKDFFKQYDLSNFKFTFKSSEKQESLFAIANYSSKSESLRITFHFKKSDSKHEIIKIIIEKN